MSYELIAIFGLLVTIVIAEIAAFVYAVVSFREIMRIQRAVAGLITQESLKIQELMRS
jgi:hypothetical protein